jgi:hypothetical protein
VEIQGPPDALRLSGTVHRDAVWQVHGKGGPTLSESFHGTLRHDLDGDGKELGKKPFKSGERLETVTPKPDYCDICHMEAGN